jgi:hypothetical protein
MTQHVGQVLVQPPAVRDREQLEAAADREHRQVALEGARQQQELEVVAARLDDRLRMRRLAVAGGVHIGPAGQDQPVETVQDVDVGSSGVMSTARPPLRCTDWA